jgi:1-acyl-sn-glycerol-3-phosphate acyltransferase
MSGGAEYDHSRWELQRRFLRMLIKNIGFVFLAKIDRVDGLDNVPKEGAVIVVMNHIAFIDSLVVLNVFPRNLVPLAKKEVYTYPVIGVFPKIWGVIPVEREGLDRQALRRAEQVLRAGETILIAPEGTRGPALQEGKEGVAYLATRSNSAILPVGVFGTEGFPTYPFSRQWRNKGATVRFGKPFRYRDDIDKPDRYQLRRMTDEAMIKVAQLLPENRRGVYAHRINEKLTTILPD